MATLADIRDTVLAKLTDQGGSVSEPTSDQVTAQINSVIDFYETYPFWFTETVVTGLCVVNDPLLPIPSDFGAFIEPDGVVIEQAYVRYPQLKVTPLQYDTMYVGGNGLPRFYCYRDGVLQLYYPPDQAYTYYLHYRKTYPDLVNDDDTNDFTLYASRLIQYKTLAECYMDYRSDPDMATYYDNKIVEELREIKRQSYERMATGNLTTENVSGRSRSTLYAR